MLLPSKSRFADSANAMALMNFMRLSLMQTAQAAVSWSRVQETRVAPSFRPRYAFANLGTRPVPIGFCYDIGSAGTAENCPGPSPDVSPGSSAFLR
jgi:hypothetical protein